MNILLLCVALCATITAQELEDYEETDVYVDNAKENYYRYVRAYEGEGVLQDTGTGDIPKPGGFRIYETRRRKRDVEDVDKLAEEELGKPLEVVELEPENATELSYEVQNDGVKNDVVINDFIRFKREAEEMTEKSEKLEGSKDADADIDTLRPKREHERSGKMLLSSSTQSMADGNREPRGATKEQWIKQPYPVQTTNPNRNYDDNVPSSSDVRPPRVHFVTQRRSESAPPLVYHSYDREGRNRDFNRDRDMEQGGYYPRPPRHYNPQPPAQQNYPYRQDSYYRDERDRRQEYDYPRYEDDRPVPPSYPKQRRIIYYATLPEVVRSPPSVDLRDRFNYRERDRGGYDNRYVTSSPVSVGTGSGESYRYRSGGNPYGKSRYDEASKSAYPTKVSTDVTVREVKKNPERRIYSEADRRFAYKLPSYHHDDGGYDRN